MEKKATKSKFDKIDYNISRWMYVYGKRILRFSLALVFIWFGYLKLIEASPASDIIRATVFWFDSDIFLKILGVWEVAIGVFLCFQKTTRLALLLLILQMPGTFLPLVILPEICFVEFPFILSMEGQYVIKNLILISAAIVIGGTVREIEFIDDKMPSKEAESKF